MRNKFDSKTGPFTNSVPPGISASFLNAVESVLSRGSGDTETGKYIIEGNAGTASYFISSYIPSLSRSATPVSITIDTADIAAASLTSGPTAQNLTANGFQVVGQTSGNVSDARGGGNYTIHF